MASMTRRVALFSPALILAGDSLWAQGGQGQARKTELRDMIEESSALGKKVEFEMRKQMRPRADLARAFATQLRMQARAVKRTGVDEGVKAMLAKYDNIRLSNAIEDQKPQFDAMIRRLAAQGGWSPEPGRYIATPNTTGKSIELTLKHGLSGLLELGAKMNDAEADAMVSLPTWQPYMRVKIDGNGCDDYAWYSDWMADGITLLMIYGWWAPPVAATVAELSVLFGIGYLTLKAMFYVCKAMVQQ